MYKFSYAEVLEDTPQTARQRDRVAIQHSIDLLQIAANKGPRAREAIDALHFLRRLWAFFIEDLAKAENELPPALRADLISVGLWLMREAEEIRQGRSTNFKGLIEVSQLIAEGLT
jgi:flagellar biosynthesis activator protein FlaF